MKDLLIKKIEFYLAKIYATERDQHFTELHYLLGDYEDNRLTDEEALDKFIDIISNWDNPNYQGY